MTVCIYRPFRAFHWRSHFQPEKTQVAAQQTPAYVYCTPPPLRAFSVCSTVCVSARTLAALKIECTPNYCCKHRCGKPGLPPPKSQTCRPAHSTLCVPVWEHRKSSQSVCVQVCKFVRKESVQMCVFIYMSGSDGVFKQKCVLECD